MLCETLKAAHITDGVVHRIHIRYEVLEQDQLIGIESMWWAILQRRSTFLLRHIELPVL